MLFDDFTRKRSERKFQFVGIPVSEEYRKIIFRRQISKFQFNCASTIDWRPVFNYNDFSKALGRIIYDYSRTSYIG